MTNESPSFYAIIPATVRYDERLTPNAKLLYGEITALCNAKGFCWATNDYFSGLYKVSKTSISMWVKQLIDCGYIKSELEYKPGTKEILHRYLRLFNDPTQENLNTTTQENLKDNITDTNTTLNTTKEEELHTGTLFGETEKEKKTEKKGPDYAKVESAYFTNFKSLYTQGRVAGEKPIIDASWYPKVRKRVKAVADIVPEEKIVHAINAAMSDDWIVSQGYSLLTILADTQLNKLINGKSQPAKTGMTRQRSTMLDMREA